jgi:hypothetical protein
MILPGLKRRLAMCAVVTMIGIGFLFLASQVSPHVLAASIKRGAALAPNGNDACALVSAADIAKVTSIKVGSGTAGKAMPGVLGRCTWTGEGNTKVILTLGDAQHIGLTIKAAEETGGEAVAGLGTKAVGMKGAAFTGGGYIINVLDAKGGFGVSILGKEGTRDRAIALAKFVESRR